MSAYNTFGEALAQYRLQDYFFQGAPYALALAAIAGPDSGLLRKGFFYPAILWTALEAQTNHRLGIQFYDYFAAIFALCVIIRCTDLLLIRHAEEYKRHGEEAPKFSEKPFSKLAWAIDLMLNLRGIGWDWQVIKKLPRPPPDDMTRKAFILRQVRDMIFTGLLADACHTYGRSQPYFKSYPSPDHPAPRLADFPFPVIITNLIVITTFIYCVLSAIHMSVSIIVVSLIHAPPSDWPPAFGPPTASTSVRRFWSATWHQELRAIFTMPAFAIAHITGANVHTTLAKTLIGISAFAVSACLHLFPALLTPAPKGTFVNRGWDSATFFLLQPAAIAFELVIISLNAALEKKGLSPFSRKRPVPEANGASNGDAKGEKKKPKTRSELNALGVVVGFLWTWTWLCLSGTYFIRDLSNMGIFEFNGAPVSFGRWLEGGPLVVI